MGGSWDICQGLRNRHTLVEVVDRGVERIRLRANGREVRFERCEVAFGWRRGCQASESETKEMIQEPHYRRRIEAT